MERRHAITTAAAASLTLLAGAAGMVLNADIVRGRGHDTVGQLTPVTVATPPVTIFVDAPATPSTQPVLNLTPAVRPSDARPASTSSASPTGGGQVGDHGHDNNEQDGHYDD